MNTISLLSAGVVALLTCPMGQAQLTMDSSSGSLATVNWGAQVSYGLATAEGVLLPAGDLVRIGSFGDLTDAEIQAAQSDFSLLNSRFVQFGTAVIGENYHDAAGYWAAVTAQDTDALSLTGKKIYLWAFNSATADAATEQGIFKSAKLPDWLFPSSSPVGGVTSIDLSDVQSSGILVGGINSD